MNISLSNIGKRYNYEWIFRGISFEFRAGEHCVLLGANGSGKSTLLQLIASSMIASEGIITYSNTPDTYTAENIFRKLSYAAPYLDLYEEFTLAESIEFHRKFKPFFSGHETSEILDISGLAKARNKQLKYFSSGMKQRVKLVLAILSDTEILLLDEPASNLDKDAIGWYQQLVGRYAENRTIIVASNEVQHEYPFCTRSLKLENYK